MKNLITIAILSIALIGCRSSQKLVTKAYNKDVSETAKMCYNLFPPKDSIIHTKEYIKGDTDTFKTPPIVLDCDSLIKVNKGTNKGNKITHVCPPSTHTVDTFRDIKYIVQQDGRMKAMYEGCNDETIKQKEQIKQLKKVKRNQLIFIICLLSYFVIRNIIRFKLPLIYKFLP